jgi:hypothetical protein
LESLRKGKTNLVLVGERLLPRVVPKFHFLRRIKLMKTSTFRLVRELGLVVAVSGLIVSLAAQQSVAQSNQLSDELLITGPGGAPVYQDTLLPEGAGGPGNEGSILFAPGAGLPTTLPAGFFIGTGIVGGALPAGTSYVIMTEEAGFVPDPLELPPPVWIGPDNHDYYVSDVLINALTNQAGLPPSIVLVSDDNPDLAAIVGLLPPTTPFLAETGLLQDLTPLMGFNVHPVLGPLSVFVRSDVPEPSTLVLATLGGLALLAYRRRK